MAKHVLVSPKGNEYPTDSEVNRARLMASGYQLKKQQESDPSAKVERTRARQAHAAMVSPLIPESKPSD